EIRADRTLAEVMAAIPPLAPGRQHGGDLQEPRHALSLNTAIRYMTAASMATQRAERAFLAHRRAKRDGLIVSEAVGSPEATNENHQTKSRPRPKATACLAEKCTNELQARPPPRRLPFPDALAALRARLDRLRDGPGPRTEQDWDLVAAIRAAKLPVAVRTP